MKIYMIRHGETDWNKVFRLQGHADIPLNEEGKMLAEITAQALSTVDFTRIYTSPLKRAKETALILKGSRDISVIEEERIKEISFGIYEGYHCSEAHYDIPDPDFINFFKKPEAYIPPQEAESIEHLCARTTDFLMELAHNKDMKDETILISTHGAAIRGLLSTVHKRSKSEFWKGGVHKNCAVTILEVTNGQISLVEEAKIYY